MSRHYVTLDAMRGIAALMVAAFHLGGADLGLFPHAYLAVDFFFILSGVVVAQAYEGKLADGRMTAGRFMLVRLIRLWPLYAAGFGLAIAYALLRSASGLQAPPDAADVALQAFMLPPLPFTEGWLYPLNVPAWSLLFELLANFAYALGLRKLSNRAMGALVVLAAGAVIMSALAYGSLDVGPKPGTLPGGLARVAFGFFAGVLIYRLAPRIETRSGWAFAGLSLALVAMLAVGSPGLTDLPLALIASPLLVVLAARYEPPEGFAPFAKWLGLISYGVYVLHMPLALWTESVLARVVQNPGPGLSVCVALAVICLAATLADGPDKAVRKLLSRGVGLHRVPALERVRVG